MLLLFCVFIRVPPSFMQPPLPLSLPVHMSVHPPPWNFLPLSQADLGSLFSNSSPFSFSQSLFMLPSPGSGPGPSLQASFGPYSVTQYISEAIVPPVPPLAASLLSEHVERERTGEGQVSFRVKVLFHLRGDASNQGTSITLHAFKETEEHSSSCIPQPPLGLCVVALTLPSDWFDTKHSNHSHQAWDGGHSSIQPHDQRQGGRRPNSRGRQSGTSRRLHLNVDSQTELPHRHTKGLMRNQIQLYYSSSDVGADPKRQPTGSHELIPKCNYKTVLMMRTLSNVFSLIVSERVEDRAQRQLFHIKAVTLQEEEEENDRKQSRTREEETCLNGQDDEELGLDSHVRIRYHRGPVVVGSPVRLSVGLRANLSAESVAIRLKVKKGLVSMVAQRSLTSDLWAVTLEKSHGSKHNILSILCHKRSPSKPTQSPALFHQVLCLSVEGLRRSFGVAMTVSANWWVEYAGHSEPSSPQGAAVSTFSFTDRHIIGIAPITESNTIINTAILTNQLVSLPAIVVAISHDGTVSDVTPAVTCYSTNENTVKVSDNCSSLFVDGSESGLGSTCVAVRFLLGALSGSVCLQVWAPSVPLRVFLGDPVLNAIDGWNHFTETGCVPVYQRTSIQVLTHFTAQDSQSRTVYLLRSSDWLVDVTELVRDWLRVEDPRVALLGPQNNLIGLQPGKTSLRVVSEQWDGVLGKCDIIVTSEPVVPGDLSVQVVSDLGMSVMGNPIHPSIVTTTVTAYNVLYNPHQEASISIWLQFSDDTASLLSFFSDLSFFMRLSSLDETVVVVAPGSSQRIVAQGEGGGPLIRAELLATTCSNRLITVNSISEGDWDWMDTRGRGGTRRLAKGSGWIRVNLDLGFLPTTGVKDEEGEEFNFDISDTLVETDSDIYAAHFEEDNSENVGSDYYDKIRGRMLDRQWNEVRNEGMISRNSLERAVLMPSKEEGAVYFSPAQEKEAEKQENQEKEAAELELGLGAVLSLLALCAVLFLANCLPCALRDKMRMMTEDDTEAERGGGNDKEEEQKTKQEVKEMEFIC